MNNVNNYKLIWKKKNRVSFSPEIKKILLNMSKIDKIEVMNRNKMSNNKLIKMEYGRRIYRGLFTMFLLGV